MARLEVWTPSTIRAKYQDGGRVLEAGTGKAMPFLYLAAITTFGTTWLWLSLGRPTLDTAIETIVAKGSGGAGQVLHLALGAPVIGSAVFKVMRPCFAPRWTFDTTARVLRRDGSSFRSCKEITRQDCEDHGVFRMVGGPRAKLAQQVEEVLPSRVNADWPLDERAKTLVQ